MSPTLHPHQYDSRSPRDEFAISRLPALESWDPEGPSLLENRDCYQRTVGVLTDSKVS